MTTTADKLVDAIKQLIACHDETTCPAIVVAREALAAYEAGKAQPATEPKAIAYRVVTKGGRIYLVDGPPSDDVQRDLEGYGDRIELLGVIASPHGATK